MKNKKILTLLAASALFLAGCTQAAVTERPSRPGADEQKNVFSSEPVTNQPEYLMPEIIESGIDPVDRGIYTYAYVKVKNPNPDLMIPFLNIDCLIRDSDNRIVEECYLYISDLDPSGTAIAREEVHKYPTDPAEHGSSNVYTYEFSINLDGSIYGLPSDAVSDYGAENVTLSDIRCHYDPYNPQLSFSVTNHGDEDIASLQFIVDFLYRDQVVYSTEIYAEKIIRANETYLLYPSIYSVPVEIFDEVQITPTSMRYDFSQSITIYENEAVACPD